MASTSPPTSPKCPVLPDGRAITAAFVGMDKDRFSSMFANDVQILCVSGSDCKIHPDAGAGILPSVHELCPKIPF
jgi:hypothetical protein